MRTLSRLRLPASNRQRSSSSPPAVPDQPPTFAVGGPMGLQHNIRSIRVGYQPKLMVDQSGDRYEQEADRVADAVVDTISDLHVVDSMSETTAGTQIQRFQDPADHQQAIAVAQQAFATHNRDRKLLKQYLEEGMKQKRDELLKNSCEWILDGRTKIYALTPTGDSAARLAHHGKNPATDEAFFPEGMGGSGDLNAPAEQYNLMDLDDNTNVVLDPGGKNTNGWNGSGYIAIMMKGGKTSRAAVWEVIKHEVQHDADKNREKEATATPLAGDTQPESIAIKIAKGIEGYKTEYRAYSYEGGAFSTLSPTKKVSNLGYQWTERQFAIFSHIWKSYAHTREAWDNSYQSLRWLLSKQGLPTTPSSKDAPYDDTIPEAWQQAIIARQQAIVAYVDPDSEGFNKLNSIRVDDFYKALDQIPVATADVDESTVVNLQRKILALKGNEAKYIIDAPDMQKKLKKHLNDQAYVKMWQTLRTVSG